MTSLSSRTTHPLAMTTTDEVLAVRRILAEAAVLHDASRIAYLGLEEPTPTELRSGPVDRRFRVMIQDVSTGVGMDVVVSTDTATVVSVKTLDAAVDGQLPVLEQ